MIVTVTLNHTLVAAKDKKRSAIFLTEMLGLPVARSLGKFVAVQIGDTSLDYHNVDEPIAEQHYAFLVSEKEFDEILNRIRQRNIIYWADPFKRKTCEINTWDDGRGAYFEDPSGHLLEIITRAYGSAGTAAEHPHPLIAPACTADT